MLRLKIHKKHVSSKLQTYEQPQIIPNNTLKTKTQIYQVKLHKNLKHQKHSLRYTSTSPLPLFKSWRHFTIIHSFLCSNKLFLFFPFGCFLDLYQKLNHNTQYFTFESFFSLSKPKKEKSVMIVMWCVCCSSWWHRRSGVKKKRQDEKFKFIRSKYIIKFDCYFIFMSNFFILFQRLFCLIIFPVSRNFHPFLYIFRLCWEEKNTSGNFISFNLWLRVCSWCDFHCSVFRSMLYISKICIIWKINQHFHVRKFDCGREDCFPSWEILSGFRMKPQVEMDTCFCRWRVWIFWKTCFWRCFGLFMNDVICWGFEL